jgi:hypothetical protein
LLALIAFGCPVVSRRRGPRARAAAQGTALPTADGNSPVCGSAMPALTAGNVLAQVIKKHKNCHQQYIDKLVESGVETEDSVAEIHNRIQKVMQEEFDLAKTYKPSKSEWLSHVWEGFMTPAQRARVRNTGAATPPPRRPAGALWLAYHPLLMARVPALRAALSLHVTHTALLRQFCWKVCSF